MSDSTSVIGPGIVWVTAVALVAPDRQVLLQRRRSDRAHGGLWEFPGGKIEVGETPEAAARREIYEELGVRLDIAALEPVSFASDAILLSTTGTPSPGRHVILLYACRRWHGEPACLDAAEIGWFAPERLEQLAMPPLDYPLARALKMVI